MCCNSRHSTAGGKAEYGRFSVLPRPEIYRNLRIKDSVKIDPACGSGSLLLKAVQVLGKDGVQNGWNSFVAKQREEDLEMIIREEKLKPQETREFLENAFRDGEVKTSGTDIDKLMPPVSRFGGSGRAKKKQTIIDKLRAFFEKYFGVGSSFSSEEDDPEDAVYIQDVYEDTLPSAAEQPAGYDTDSRL